MTVTRTNSRDGVMASARDLTLALGGTWHKRGCYGICLCPVHEDRSPSLSVKDGEHGLIVHCFAGCDWYDIKRELHRRGLIQHSPHRARDHRPDQFTTKATRNPERIPIWGRSALPFRIWHCAEEAPGTLAEIYLRSRGLTLPVPPTLRFQWLKHAPSNGVHPCMIALVQHGVTGTPVGIHRTFLRRDGSGKASVDPVKMALGPISGGAVQLAAAADRVLIGEGIETALSAMQVTGTPAWAALGTAGLRALDLPEHIRCVTVLADADPPGIAAANDAAWRWAGQKRDVRIARPPIGKDFNDALLAEQSS
jgi:putative DNA primase/helicase